MKKFKNHSLGERFEGINENCSLSKEEIKKCNGYQMIGDRACDSRHVPGFIEGKPYKICKYNKDYDRI